MVIQSVLSDKLYRSCRPGYGYGETQVGVDAVDAWLNEARQLGVRSILCLLDERHLACYQDIHAQGLLGHYRKQGFSVIHVPVADYQAPAVPPAALKECELRCLAAELPIVVHCSAGIDRTGAVVERFQRPCGVFAVRDGVEAFMDQHSTGRGPEHFRQVARLSLQLYDGLEAMRLHRLPGHSRATLWAAAMLHDVGVPATGGGNRHPWESAAVIGSAWGELGLETLGLALRDVATVAGLHGVPAAVSGGLLGPVEEPVAALWKGQEIPRDLQLLVAIIRVADGLDRSLTQPVSRVEVQPGEILVYADTNQDIATEVRRAQEKAGLLNHLSGNLTIRPA